MGSEMCIRDSFLIAQEPAEELTWNLEDYVDDSGSSWVTVRFPTIRGAVYTLASSPDLQTWTPINSFYALDNELHLALFERNPSPDLNEGGLPEPEDIPDLQPVSITLRPLADNSGTAVIWRSVDPFLDSEIVQRILPIPLDTAWENLPLYFNQHEDYLFFIIGTVHSPVSPNFQETPNLSFRDNQFFSVLQGDFGDIQNTVVTDR